MTSGSVQPRPGMTGYAQPEGGPRFLSDVIVERGLADEDHVRAAVDEARSSHATVGQILVEHGRLTEDDLAHALAARYGLWHVELDEFEPDPEAANLIPPPVAQRYRAVPLAFEPDGALLVAMADPSDSVALTDIGFMTHRELRAAVAPAGAIAELAARLPLPTTESADPEVGGAMVAPAPAVPPVAPSPVAPSPAVPAPAAPPPFEDRAELAAARVERDAARDELAAARVERDAAQDELATVRAQLDQAHAEFDAARSERDALRAEREASRSERDGLRSERDTLRSERNVLRAELDVARADLERARNEAEAHRGLAERTAAAIERAAEAERRLAELGDAEQRMEEVHAMVDRMRNDFELEREGYAEAERTLRLQNDKLRETYAAAKRWSAELAHGADELSATLDSVDLDG